MYEGLSKQLGGGTASPVHSSKPVNPQNFSPGILPYLLRPLHRNVEGKKGKNTQGMPAAPPKPPNLLQVRPHCMHVKVDWVFIERLSG
jgi:hypothetical protein